VKYRQKHVKLDCLNADLTPTQAINKSQRIKTMDSFTLRGGFHMTKIDKYITNKNMAIALLVALLLMYLPLNLDLLGKVLVLLVAIGLFIK
jgi:hypothetical protein